MSRRAYVYMHMAILLWGFTGILGRAINMSFGSIVWYRMLIASLGMLAIIFYRKQFQVIAWRDFLKITFTGFIVMVHWLMFYAAIKFSNVSVTLSCFASVSLFTAIMDPLMNRRKIDRIEILLSVFVLLGIYIIFTAQHFYLKGILLSLASAALSAVFTVNNKKFLFRYRPELITFYELFFGWVTILVLGFFQIDLIPVDLTIPSGNDFAYLLILSLVCTTVAFSISLKALKELNPFILNLSVNLEPIYSIVLAIIIFKENTSLNVGFYVGTAIILASVFIHAMHTKYIMQRGESAEAGSLTP